MKIDELIRKVDNASEMVFSIGGKRFTVCDEEEKGFSIAEWNRQETERFFHNAEDLVNGYQIGGKPLADQAGNILVEDYSGFEE